MMKKVGMMMVALAMFMGFMTQSASASQQPSTQHVSDKKPLDKPLDEVLEIPSIFKIEKKLAKGLYSHIKSSRLKAEVVSYNNAFYSLLLRKDDGTSLLIKGGIDKVGDVYDLENGQKIGTATLFISPKKTFSIAYTPLFRDYPIVLTFSKTNVQ